MTTIRCVHEVCGGSLYREQGRTVLSCFSCGRDQGQAPAPLPLVSAAANFRPRGDKRCRNICSEPGCGLLTSGTWCVSHGKRAGARKASLQRVENTRIRLALKGTTP